MFYKLGTYTELLHYEIKRTENAGSHHVYGLGAMRHEIEP